MPGEETAAGDRRTPESLARLVFVLSTLTATVLAVTDSADLTVRPQMLALVSTTIAVGAGCSYLFIAATRASYRAVRIALTGAPGVGKTVLAKVIFDRLMNNAAGSPARFTAEAKTAIAVHQAIRGIDDGVWPESTEDGTINRHWGRLEFSGSRRTVVTLELGDSAGEHWIDLSNRETPRSSSRRSYLEYVVSSHAIVHLVPAVSLNGPDGRSHLEREVQDLTLARQLMAQRGAKTERDIALLFVLSKSDLLIAELGGSTESGLVELIRRATLHMSIFDPGDLRRQVDDLEPSTGADALIMACSACESLSSSFGSVHIMFTSALSSQITTGADTSRTSHDLMRWVRSAGSLSRRSRRIVASSRGRG